MKKKTMKLAWMTGVFLVLAWTASVWAADTGEVIGQYRGLVIVTVKPVAGATTSTHEAVTVKEYTEKSYSDSSEAMAAAEKMETEAKENAIKNAESVWPDVPEDKLDLKVEFRVEDGTNGDDTSECRFFGVIAVTAKPSGTDLEESYDRSSEVSFKITYYTVTTFKTSTEAKAMAEEMKNMAIDNVRNILKMVWPEVTGDNLQITAECSAVAVENIAPEGIFAAIDMRSNDSNLESGLSNRLWEGESLKN
ncbi:MAG: hypothetical protein PHW04_18475 [Candidatus Wallbacteria bacterium]|nr:hypothetical protein [Candidatus Wallbacteria bacterium]